MPALPALPAVPAVPAAPLAATAAPDAAALRRAMQRDAWFRDCGEPLQDALIALGRLRQLAEGEPLFAQGQPEGGLHCVLAGALVVQSRHDQHRPDAGDELPLLVVLEPTHWLGELSFTDGLPRSHDAVADRPAQVWCVPRERLLAWLDAHPRHWRDIARLAVGKLRLMYEVVDAEMRRPVTQRVARRLWLALQGWGWRRHDPQRSLRWSQEQLARMLGTSRGSVNRSLRELQQAGAIRLHYGVIEVANWVRLREACDGLAEPAALRPAG